jgi:hypothetical protein
MLGLKLVHLIERHSDELALGLTDGLRNLERTCDFQKIARDELYSGAVDLYGNLEQWLVQKNEVDIEKRFRTIGARRATQGVHLPEMMWALVISRNHLWNLLQRECFADNLLELSRELEVLQTLNSFFDRAMYYSTLGFEDTAAHDGRMMYAHRRSVL